MHDFDKLTERRGTGSYKWDVGEGELPMFVADMDFECAEPIRRAIERTADVGIFGYATLPEEYFTSISDYFARHHGVRFDTRDMIYSSGIVAAISSMVRRLTHPNECVLIMAPVYNIFYNSIRNNGRRVLSSDLSYEAGRYSIDFADLEAKMAMPETTLMILCNPHNPTGNVWSREELSRIGRLAARYSVTVISDEIHCDITRLGVEYTPFYSVSEECRGLSITAVSAGKTFNIAGLQSAALVIHDSALRYRVWRGLNNDEVAEPNVFASKANIAAFTECDDWVLEMRRYVFRNRDIAEERVRQMGLLPVRADATYLLWVDISAISMDSDDFTHRLREATGLYVTSGREYGEVGSHFVRINLATQRSRVIDGISRLESFVKSEFDRIKK